MTVLFVLLILQLSSVEPHSAVRGCVLQDGVGTDSAQIGVTTRAKGGVGHSGMTFLYKGTVLNQIFVTDQSCKTSKGVKIGSTDEEVKKAYGLGNETAAYLSKGKSDRLGILGDSMLSYPGVAFVMSKGQVAAILLTAPQAETVHSK